MLYVLVTLTVLTLITLYMNKTMEAKFLVLVTAAVFLFGLYDSAREYYLMIKFGFAGFGFLVWDILKLLIIAAECLFVFLNKRKISFVLLYVMLAVLIISKWNMWLTYIYKYLG